MSTKCRVPTTTYSNTTVTSSSSPQQRLSSFSRSRHPTSTPPRPPHSSTWLSWHTSCLPLTPLTPSLLHLFFHRRWGATTQDRGNTMRAKGDLAARANLHTRPPSRAEDTDGRRCRTRGRQRRGGGRQPEGVRRARARARRGLATWKRSLPPFLASLAKWVLVASLSLAKEAVQATKQVHSCLPGAWTGDVHQIQSVHQIQRAPYMLSGAWLPRAT